jgi:hypothetical protein
MDCRQQVGEVHDEVGSGVSGFGSLGLGLWVQVLGFGSLGLGLWVWVSGSGSLGLGLWVSFVERGSFCGKVGVCVRVRQQGVHALR